MRSSLTSIFLALILGFLGGCATPIDRPLSGPPATATPVTAKVVDLRAAEWKTTRILQNSQGVVQHLGDDKFPNSNLATYLTQRLSRTLAGVSAQSVIVKTTDIRLSIPGARFDDTQMATAVATSGLIAAPVFALTSTTTRNKSASAVLCVNIDGRDYLGNDARLFRFGPDGELRESIEAAIAVLDKNIAAGVSSTSVACQAGWEGGQSRP